MTQTNETANGGLGVTGAIKAKAAGFVEEIKEMGKEQIDTKKQATANQVDKLAGVVERATEELDRGDFPWIAAYAYQLSAKIKTFANGLRDRNMEELVDDVRQAARRNPKMFFIGSIATGIALSRFFKASQRRDSQNVTGESWQRRDSDSTRESSWGDRSAGRLEDERMESMRGSKLDVSLPTFGKTPSKGA